MRPRTLESLEPCGREIALSIGMFDGLHVGHRRIVAALVESAARQGLEPAVMTFRRHPLAVTDPERAPALLTSSEERTALLGELGVRTVYLLEFDEAFARREAAAFAGLLADELRVRALVCGRDFRFGAGRQGSAETFGDRMAVVTVDPETVDGERVSSSLVRRLLSRGRVEDAAGLLDRAYRLAGTVIRGEEVGTGLEFATANIAPEGRALPGAGVYGTAADFGEGERSAVTYVGRRPTFDGAGTGVETHVPGEERDLYGKRLTIDFLRRLRGEESFRDGEALSRRIREDIEAAVGGRREDACRRGKSRSATGGLKRTWR